MTTCTEEEMLKVLRSTLTQQKYRSQYNQEHKAEILEQLHQSYPARKVEIAEYSHNYYLENKERLLEQQRQYRLEHPERQAIYNQRRKKEKAEYLRRHNKEHPEPHRQSVRNRRALLANSNGNFTAEEFRLLCEVYENKCAYCHSELPLVPDHMTPLSRGGSNYIDNIVPACESCNSKKHTMTYDEYIERLSKESME